MWNHLAGPNRIGTPLVTKRKQRRKQSTTTPKKKGRQETKTPRHQAILPSCGNIWSPNAGAFPGMLSCIYCLGLITLASANSSPGTCYDTPCSVILHSVLSYVLASKMTYVQATSWCNDLRGNNLRKFSFTLWVMWSITKSTNLV